MEKREIKMAGNTVITINIAEDLPYLNVDEEGHFYLDTEERDNEYYANTFLYTIHYTVLEGLSGIEWSIDGNNVNISTDHFKFFKDKYKRYLKNWIENVYDKNKQYELTTKYDPVTYNLYVFLKEKIHEDREPIDVENLKKTIDAWDRSKNGG